MEAIIPEHETFLAALAEHRERRPNEALFTFLADGTGDGTTWSHVDLDRAARRVADRLRAAGVPPRSTVLLMTAPGLDYVAGFFGCLYAGMIAVPAYPPSPMHGRDNMDRLQAVADSADVSVGLTTSALLTAVEGFTVAGAPIMWIMLEDDGTEPEPAIGPPPAAPDDIAFLQYTSGSTGDPKGVMVSQANLLANAQMIGRAYGSYPDYTMVSWLPPYHDMGLIGMLLCAPVLDLHAIFMPPAVFLRRPVRWLQAISRYRAEASAGPNFAYEACIEKIKDADLADLDLSSWRVAINGAEPVRAATMERFSERFAQCGFQPTAFRPAYGLAETTLMAATGTADGPTIYEAATDALATGSLRPPVNGEDAQRLVGNGRPPAGAEITIIDPETGEPLPDRQIGEICVRGPHVTKGYWRRPDATAEKFTGDALRTGDLGCLVDGELVVTGRIKDVLIIRGRNYYPHDIELTVETSNPTFRRGCGVAFTVEHDDRELLVVVQEVNPGLIGEPAPVVENIRRAITLAHGIAVSAVVLTRPGAVPKTSSGKVRRSDTRRLFLADDLAPVFVWRSGQLEPAGAATD